MFEENIAEYTGSPYAVACDNCTNAIKICCDYYGVDEVTIPKRTYLSVAQSIIQSGGKVKFEDIDWKGIYQLKPYPIYDAAKRLTSNMYKKGTLMCLSFGIQKPLKLGKGGMILTDSIDAYEKLKKLRWSGRSEDISYNKDQPSTLGYNSYITPELAAWGMMMLSVYPKHADDQIEDPDYRDLTTFDIFNS
jgi:dTDP-4-amino-4,6-dideoxygalactose transaminase